MNAIGGRGPRVQKSAEKLKVFTKLANTCFSATYFRAKWETEETVDELLKVMQDMTQRMKTIVANQERFSEDLDKFKAEQA